MSMRVFQFSSGAHQYPFILLLLSLSVVLITIFSFSPVNGQQSLVTYENATLGLTFQYPSSWHLYNYKNGVVLSSKTPSYDFPLFNKNNLSMQSVFYDQKSTTEPPVVVQIYTKMTDKTLQQTTSEIARGISSTWSGAGGLTHTVLMSLPAYSFRIDDASTNLRVLLIWGLKPITQQGYSGISKQYNVAYIAEGFDFDIYENDFNSIISSVRINQDDKQIAEQYEVIKIAEAKDKEASRLHRLHNEQQKSLIILQQQHNNMVEEDLTHIETCNADRKDIDDTRQRLMQLKKTNVSENDLVDLESNINYFQLELDKCKVWKPTTNLTQLKVQSFAQAEFYHDPVLQYGISD